MKASRRANSPIFTVADCVRWVRSQRKIETLEVIAVKLGCDSVAVRHWLAGRRNPSRQVRTLAALLAHGPRELPPGL